MGKCVFAFEDRVISAVAPVIGRKRRTDFVLEVKWNSDNTPLRNKVNRLYYARAFLFIRIRKKKLELRRKEERI